MRPDPSAQTPPAASRARSDARIGRILSWLAGAIALTITVAGPMGYWLLAKQAETREAAVAARLHAAFLSQAIGGRPQDWRSRVAGLIDADLTPSELPEQRRIESLTGEVLAASGPPPAAPVLQSEAPLATADGPLGRVVVARGLRPLLLNTAGVALLALGLGLAVFASLRLLPLRALRRTLDALSRQEMQARIQAEEQLRIVLDNTVEGVLVFRPDGEVLSGNKSAATLLGRDAAALAGQRLSALIRLPPSELAAPAVGSLETVLLRQSGLELAVEVGFSHMQVSGAPQMIAIVRDITERQQHEARLARLANFDGLTGLPNRSLFRDRLHTAMARSRRAQQDLALMFIDLDRFKNINDSLGHEVGDQLLVAVANRLSQCLRETDSLARSTGSPPAAHVFRLGGDEFTVLVEDLNQHSIAAGIAIAQRILTALSPAFLIADNELFISASIGITMYAGEAEIDIDALIKQADLAMYRAKALGRDGYHFFNAELNQDLHERQQREVQLRRALERQEFSLHYQPKLSVRDGRVTGVEALLRWQPSGEELVMPDRFVSILEETGLIVPVGAWVFREACQQMKRWQAQGLPALSLAVNLSSRQFRQPQLAAQIAAVLAETGFDAHLLEIELTESLLIEDSEGVLRILHELGAMGVRIAIDDFGTGHSSLSYLKRFDVDTLKIDRAFVRDTPHNTQDCAIVRAVIALAHGLGLNAVAEGVESQAQLDFLAAHGCEDVQGDLLSPPLPAPALAAWLRQRLDADRRPAELALG